MTTRLTSRSWLGGMVGALVLLVMPQTLLAYQFLGKWATVPITVVADSDTGFPAKVQSAILPWNNVTTAKDIFSAASTSTINFTGSNYKKAGGWGDLTDGKIEIVCDADGSAYTELGLVIGEYTGVTYPQISGGVISDAFFVLDCKTARTTADQVSTMVHEFGHMLGLAHSSVYQQLDEAIDPINPASEIPTMHWQFAAGGDTLEADDVAGVSDLYPDTTFATAMGSLEGTVTRCVTGEAVTGVNVRAVNVSTSLRRVQVTRYTGYDGNSAGRYRINGLPPGTYRIVIEVLHFPKRPAKTTVQQLQSVTTKVDTDFAAEYHNPPNEDDCSEDLPDTPANLAVAGGAALTAKNFKTNPIELAFVVDDTGSMGEEIAGVRAALSNQITRVKAEPGKPYPMTAIVSFKDDVTVRKVSRDPAVLQAMVNSLTASGGGDCPEHSNDAMLAAGKMLRQGGRALLFTDADSHSTGATSAAVSAFFVSKNLKNSTMLSGTCSGTGFSAVPIEGEEDGSSLLDPRTSQNGDDLSLGQPLSHLPPGPTLGTQSAIETYSSISLATGGLFVAIPGVNSSSTEAQRYVNVGTNIAVSASLPTVSLLLPGEGSPGDTLDIDLTGTNTNFQTASVLSFSGTGVTVNKVTVRSATLLTANVTLAAGTTLGFRDVTVTSMAGSATEAATGVGAFNVAAATSSPKIVSVVPALGSRGTTVSVTIRGANTAFTATSTPLFCTSICTSMSNNDPKITLNSKTVIDATTLVANITIAADATISYRNISVVTGTQVATESVTGPFLIGGSPLAIPQLTTVSPASAGRGQTITLTITGENTSFVSGTTVAAFGGTGITVNSTTVTSPTAATASITIAASATLGFRDVSMTTDTEVAVLLSGFTLVDAPSITTHPTNQTVTAGGNAQFTIAASGAALTYQWQVSTNSGSSFTNLTNGSPYGGVTTATLTLTGVAASFDGYRYRCVVSNPASVTSNSARLILNAIVTTPTRVNVGVTKQGAAGALHETTAAQPVNVTFPGASGAWTAVADQPWVLITNGSGSRAGAFRVSVADSTNAIGGATSLTATITVTVPSLGLTKTVPVSLSVFQPDASAAPFGAFDTPSAGATVAGSVAVTGWALDDIEVTRVEIWRDRAAGETTPVFIGSGPGNGKIFIAEPFFVSGARTDVEATYSAVPLASRAGWGYLLLTQGLWNQGNGTFTLHAFAADRDGHYVTLGSKTITASNATATTPFGSIDTPAYGQTVSGGFWNFGWALTPKASPTCTIGASGVQVSIDSGPLQPVTYGAARSDIAAAFPGFSNGAGAGGAYFIDTTTLANGAHQIGWYVTDNCSRADGVGSRFFSVLNGSSVTSDSIRTAGTIVDELVASPEQDTSGTVEIRRNGERVPVAPGPSGHYLVPIAQNERVEIQLPSFGGAIYSGYQIVNGARRALPLGSSLDAKQGTFYWHPAAAFLGAYQLDFVSSRGGVVRVRAVVGTSVHAVIDTPQSGVTPSAFVIAGWAIDEAAMHGTGIDAVHVWAYPAAGGEPILLGVASYGDPRPDIGALFGPQFTNASYSLAVEALPSGVFDVVVYPHSAVTGDFSGAKMIRIAVP